MSCTDDVVSEQFRAMVVKLLQIAEGKYKNKWTNEPIVAQGYVKRFRWSLQHKKKKLEVQECIHRVVFRSTKRGYFLGLGKIIQNSITSSKALCT